MFRNKPQPVLKQKQMSKNPTPNKQQKHNLAIPVACASTLLVSFPPLSKQYVQLRLHQHSGKRRISSPGIKTNVSLDRSPRTVGCCCSAITFQTSVTGDLTKQVSVCPVSQIYQDHFQFCARHLKHLQPFPAWHQLKIQMV